MNFSLILVRMTIVGSILTFTQFVHAQAEIAGGLTPQQTQAKVETQVDISQACPGENINIKNFVIYQGQAASLADVLSSGGTIYDHGISVNCLQTLQEVINTLNDSKDADKSVLADMLQRATAAVGWMSLKIQQNATPSIQQADAVGIRG